MAVLNSILSFPEQLDKLSASKVAWLFWETVTLPEVEPDIERVGLPEQTAGWITTKLMKEDQPSVTPSESLSNQTIPVQTPGLVGTLKFTLHEEPLSKVQNPTPPTYP